MASCIAPAFCGLKVVLWLLDSGDWRSHTHEDALRAAEYVKVNIKPRDIVLLHDNNPAVLTVLDLLLPQLRRQRIDLEGGIVALSGRRKS